ncbi:MULTISPECIES: DNA polymerase I [Marivita]|uniref:DNA polymerase I n=1 Tax=Marivita cryptomonadis TaxID=505252 RepID=A0A9Q2S4Z5_9RHOB|nr:MULTISPECIES: DNA polymerase I [Marivita]MCR9169788.1 DNA polymerase I [Paracoccaceae bacterium]MBM2321678.1 DNA polymerase I [Marivita cryptomonadis]MBM2331259.1 DNA polymerase I [Marivita cryptomonadis]MBM2340845.1 DNA polymerase I [Marivita cryptomonadis]MBM2345507.1 DNA polymerase I [Marivita cryptomonadis]
MAFGKGHHLHLIDGSAFIFRAYHALPPLTRKSDGLPIGAVSGFCNMLQRYVEGNAGSDVTHVAVIFDKGSHTFRNDMYDQYKANREAMPEDLRPQIPLTRRATEAFNIACEELEGYEADDIIATLAVQGRKAGGRVTIISSDKDLMQLVGDGVEMFDAMKNRTIDREGVFEKFGVYPERVVDVQALAGDSVDNVPGAPGIGIKTAALLINEFGSLEELLDRAGEIKQPKRRETLIEKRDQIEMSKKLVLLDENTPLGFTIDDLEVRDPDPDKLMTFLAEMEFRTLTKRIAEALKVEAPAIPDTTPEGANPPSGDAPELPAMDTSHYECVRDLKALQAWIDAANETGWVAFDTETTGLNEMTADLVGISLCVEPGKACYIPLLHRAEGGEGLFGSDDLADGQVPLDDALAALKPLLEDPAVMKIGQNMKYDAKIMARLGISVAPIDDTMLMSYAMNAGLHGHGMDTLAERYLGHTPIPIKDLLGSGKSQITFDRVPIDKAVPYAAEDAEVTLRLWQMFKPQLHQTKVTRVYESMERPLVPVLAKMEMAGIKVDRDTLSRMSNAFSQKMAGLEDEIYELVGRKFNVGSPKQLGEILFDEMGLEGGKRGKTGAYATGADVLEDLATEHELPRRVLDWRQLSKLKSTYTDALQDHINRETGRVHTSYSIAGANTGRLASTDPNLQNIPIRTEEGRRIREAFVAEDGKTLVALDYSQIELRILAHIADIQALKDAFKEGQDIHAATASEMFNVPLDEMTPDVRRQAKAINFGVIYGISGFGLARNLRIPRAEAQGFIDRYFERFPGIKAYMDDTTEFAKKHNRVETLFGRVIHTPEINAKGPRAGFAKRAAINAPIQGTAADIIRRAMIRMPDAIAKLSAKMLLQVHDELLFEVEQGAEDELIKVAREVMEGAADPVVHLTVPLIADAGQGKNWAEAH